MEPKGLRHVKIQRCGEQVDPPLHIARRDHANFLLVDFPELDRFVCQRAKEPIRESTRESVPQAEGVDAVLRGREAKARLAMQTAAAKSFPRAVPR